MIVRWKDNIVEIGAGRPVVIQSMTNTDTADVESSTKQVLELAQAGSELVRLTVNTPAAAKAIPEIRRRLDETGCFVPLVGDFHYNGHKLLTEYPECAEALSKYRINPGNVGKGDKQEENFRTMVELAKKYDKPVRIGVNWGSLDQDLLACMMSENQKLENALRRIGGEQLYIRHIDCGYELWFKIAEILKPLRHKAVFRGYFIRTFESAAFTERLQHMHQRIAAAERVAVRMGVAQHEYIIVFAQQLGRAGNVNSHLHLPSDHRAYERYSCRALSSRRRQT